MKEIFGLNKPIFGGSLETAKLNYLSHKWFQPFEYEPLYCASCDVRDYHKGAFYPCFVNDPKNGYGDFTKEDFDNLTWDERKRESTKGVSYFEIINFTEEDAINAVNRLNRTRRFLNQSEVDKLFGTDLDNIPWENLHKLLEEE